MEVFTLVLSSLISLISPVGLGVDTVAERAIRSQFKSVEQLQVRIDNAPSHQILRGKANRIRIAGRGLVPLQDVRLEALEVETDPINLNRRRLLQRRGKLQLEEPLQTGVRLVLKEDDIAQALKSPVVMQQLQKLVGSLGGLTRQSSATSKLVNPQVEFLDNQRIRVQAELQDADTANKLVIQVESGVEVVAGRRLRLINPTARLNGAAIPENFVKSIAESLTERYDLGQLEPSGVTARILRLELDSDQLELAVFIKAPAGLQI
ncbi:MAG: DUF2993 domain-containing protein [Leptolyngbyaceae cyanobacterium RU_5_1]|nr:DUF2993 domain-containing protein [Leptolyngbyaceae cyanobacterium RU_5_1]